jgi:hypothetical protein
MRQALADFKDCVEELFFEFYDFKTLKYHMLEHYITYIDMFGSLLNGDTDTTEGLHPAVKQAYKKSNKKGN